MDSPARNPSPPPELRDNADLVGAESIGNTAFSKHWLFSTLMKLIEEVDKETEEGTEDAEFGLDVDEELQNELCKLWDMSMNADVALFLQEFKAVDILTGIINKSNAPRVTEICVGILGNMACEDSVCKFMSEKSELIDLMLVLLEVRDSPTLVETTRLIYTSLSHSTAQQTWVKAVKRSEEILGHLMFIFQSSTNCDLLKNTAELVDTLLDLEPDLCVSWATQEFVGSLLEAIEQIGCSHSDALEVYLHVFQSLSTTEPGVESLVSYAVPLQEKLLKYLNIVCEYEIVGLDGKEASLASALSVLHILFTLPDQPAQTAHTLAKDEKMIRIFLKILEPLHPMLQHYKRNSLPETNQSNNNMYDNKPIMAEQICHVTDGNQSNREERFKDADGNAGETVGDSENEKEYRHLKMLYEVLAIFIVDFISYLFSTREHTKNAVTSSTDQSPKDQKATDEESKGDHAEQNSADELSPLVVDCLPILTYLNDACSRCRINFLMLTLRENQSGPCLVNKFLNISSKHDLQRLVRIITDVNAGKIVSRAESSKRSESSDT